MPIDYFIANKLNHDHGGPLRVIGISNSTRSQIVSELRKSGTLSVNELTERVGISSMGIRQHLAYLEKNGLTSQEQRRQPLGRPCAYYRLTEAAEALFPKLYAHFAAGILNDISEHEGKDKLELIFKWR
ncbi:MAG TPA: DeoR family transcriptional regulator, partial [Actinobacteria bacterium]|nr:DeoR family transcriptional regulator [Actinomycetes bacterium]HEX21467.1 DeoR family transcriptional regulator [Actinomycetota bacterium]